jgi:C_GCAxxG_C_C family probable redox protein
LSAIINFERYFRRKDMATERAQKAYELGKSFEKNYKGCAQCAVAALQDAIDCKNDDVFAAATSLAGGGVRTADGNCGAYIGCLLVLGTLVGRKRDDFADRQGIRYKNFDLATKLRRKFIEEYGSVICSDIQNRVFGRYFYLADPQEFQKFEDAGGHADTGCPEVVGKAARWMVEIIEEAGLLPE